jgi:hypothetical protein
MKPIPESPLNKIALLFLLPLLLAAGLWAWLSLPAAQAQGGDEDLWRTLVIPFERIANVTGMETLEASCFDGGKLWL